MIFKIFTTFLSKKSYRYLMYTTFGVLMVGILGYRFLENWRWIDCVNYAVSTMVTTGNAGVLPQSDGGKIFNIFYMFVSVLLILFFISTVQQHFQDLLHSQKIKHKRHRKLAEEHLPKDSEDAS